MKSVMLVISLLFSLSAFGGDSGSNEAAALSIKLYPSIGAGIKPMSDGKQLYGTVKVFPLQYGPADIGFSLLGVGYSFGENSSVSFSPIGLRALNWMVSLDIQQNRADGAGLSLNYYIPLDFP